MTDELVKDPLAAHAGLAALLLSARADQVGAGKLDAVKALDKVANETADRLTAAA